MTCQALEQILFAMLVIVERQSKDHLQGGIYDPSDEVMESASNVPANNKASESDFAILDLLIRMKPRANVETFQTITMFHRNKTIGWLNTKSEKEREELMNKSRKRSEEIKLKRKKEIVQETQNLKKELEAKAALKKTGAVNALLENSVTAWISVEIATKNIKNKNIKSIDESQRLNMFYKHVNLGGRSVITIHKIKQGKKVNI